MGDIAAVWLTISGVAIAAGVALYLLWCRGKRVGTFTGSMIVLAGSAVAALMIGEIGQTSGSYTTGAGSATANAVIAYALLGLVIIGCGAAFAFLRAKR